MKNSKRPISVAWRENVTETGGTIEDEKLAWRGAACRKGRAFMNWKISMKFKTIKRIEKLVTPAWKTYGRRYHSCARTRNSGGGRGAQAPLGLWNAWFQCIVTRKYGDCVSHWTRTARGERWFFGLWLTSKEIPGSPVTYFCVSLSPSAATRDKVKFLLNNPPIRASKVRYCKNKNN